MTPQEALSRVIEHREIFHEEMLDVMRQIMSGEVTPVMMAALFFLVVLPIGVLLRLFGRDRLNRHHSESVVSYRLKPNKENIDGPV